MKYLVVDASLNGTGIRDRYEGGYLSPIELGVKKETIERLNEWLSTYANEHYNGYVNQSIIIQLDNEGIAIAVEIKKELQNIKMEYFSDAKMTRVNI